MTTRIQLPNESWLHTKPSITKIDNDSHTAILSVNTLQVQTNSERETKSISISKRMEMLENDPRRAQILAKARNKLAASKVLDDVHPLKKMRLKSGLSQNSLAKAVGTSQAQIAKLESGATDPQKSTIVRLAKVLNLNPTDVFAAFLSADDLNISGL